MTGTSKTGPFFVCVSAFTDTHNCYTWGLFQSWEATWPWIEERTCRRRLHGLWPALTEHSVAVPRPKLPRQRTSMATGHVDWCMDRGSWYNKYRALWPVRSRVRSSGAASILSCFSINGRVQSSMINSDFLLQPEIISDVRASIRSGHTNEKAIRTQLYWGKWNMTSKNHK